MAHRLPAVRSREGAGLHADVRPHRSQQRADARDARGRRPAPTSRSSRSSPQVRAVRALAPDTLLLHLQTPRSHRLRFLAGQSVTLGLAGRARGRARSHAADRQLPLRRPQPAVLRRPRRRRRVRPRAVRRRAQARRRGQRCGARVASSCWHDGQRPLVFAACDAGFAPVKSLIEHALSLDAAPSLSLFWLATRAGRPLPGQPVPRLVGGAGPVRVRAGRRTATPPPARGRWPGDARRPVRHRLRLLPRRPAGLRRTRCTTNCAPPACRPAQIRAEVLG